MEYEGQGQFKSRLQAPVTKMPESTKLTEVSEASQNARIKTLMAPPLSTAGVKRKKLAEKAVEYVRPTPPAPSSKLPGTTYKAGSIQSFSRQSSSTSSSRSASAASSRNISNGSDFSQSLNVPRTQLLRPSSSMSLYQQNPRISKPGHRPVSSLDTTGQKALDGNGLGNNSMNQFLSSSHTTVRNTNPPKHHSSAPSATTNTLPNASESLNVCKRSVKRAQSLREISISTRLGGLSLKDSQALQHGKDDRDRDATTNHLPKTPASQIPKKNKRLSLAITTPTPSSRSQSPTKSPRKRAPPVGGFLTIDSNIKCADWDVNDRLDKMETMYSDMKAALDGSTGERDNLKETMALLKARSLQGLPAKVSTLTVIDCELEMEAGNFKRTHTELQLIIDRERSSKLSTQSALDELTRKQSYESSSLKQMIDDQRRAHNVELDDLLRQKRRDLEDLRTENEEDQKKRDRTHQEELDGLRRKLNDTIEDEKQQRRRELNALTSEGAANQQRVESQLTTKDADILRLQQQLEKSKTETTFEREQLSNIKLKLSDASATIISLESSLRSSKARVEFLESDNKSQSQAFADLEQRTQDAIRESHEAKIKLRTEETLRRKLHNQVQELKGNIRVYCRVRPVLDIDGTDHAKIVFPDQTEDSKEVDVLGLEEKNSLGKVSTKNHAFTFDRVFSPQAQNAEIFDELSQLVQSALDGYNVCIFCYGQTGSGKTHTMSSDDGMIPRAVTQIYDTSMSLEEKGWKYHMEGSFVEIYNENINDLLGRAEDFDKKKHEIRHDTVNLKTTITDVQTMKLDSPGKVQQVLARAMSNRSVAATMANARSSRSHSVFILKLIGENAITGEKSEGTLNLVDLAGSERLSHSGATGDRLKETQNINKSLSCLGDVIGALGQIRDGGHIPYRNSKLTYLLQYSLGGNSKTLMFVMISPLQAHLSETLTSLKFATKVSHQHKFWG